MEDNSEFPKNKIREEASVNPDENSEDISEGKGITEKIRENPWIASSVILGIVTLILIIGNFTSFTGGAVITGGTIGVDDAGARLLSFANAQGINAQLIGVQDAGNFYEVTLSIDGSEVPVMVTKDGEYLVQGLTPLSVDTSDSASADIPKSDKPVVELYVFTYCPYGTQAEKGIIPVANLLGDKIDFRIRQIGAMHGEFEEIESERQLCIEKNYPDKFLNYVSEFVLDATCPTGDTGCVTTKINAIYSKLGISASTINSCMSSEGESLYDAEVQNAGSEGVSGSPTLIINGIMIVSRAVDCPSGRECAIADIGRDSQSYLDGICSAFNDEPEECATQLSSESPSPGFGSGSTSSSTSAQC